MITPRAKYEKGDLIRGNSAPRKSLSSVLNLFHKLASNPKRIIIVSHKLYFTQAFSPQVVFVVIIRWFGENILKRLLPTTDISRRFFACPGPPSKSYLLKTKKGITRCFHKLRKNFYIKLNIFCTTSALSGVQK
jgi:hypothetical protein